MALTSADVQQLAAGLGARRLSARTARRLQAQDEGGDQRRIGRVQRAVQRVG